MATPSKGKAKKVKKNITRGVAYIQATFNNTIVTFTDVSGNVLAWSSAGAKGFKGSRKSTPFAAQVAAEDAAEKAADHGMRSVSVVIIGPGAGREAAVRGIQSHKGGNAIEIESIHDQTRSPHNGCRQPKKRRV